jgi:hypothetical protein
VTRLSVAAKQLSIVAAAHTTIKPTGFRWRDFADRRAWHPLGCSVLLCSLFVVWEFAHQLAFLGKAPGTDHGELIVLYFGELLTLLVAGPGASSIDHLLARKP